MNQEINYIDKLHQLQQKIDQLVSVDELYETFLKFFVDTIPFKLVSYLTFENNISQNFYSLSHITDEAIEKIKRPIFSLILSNLLPDSIVMKDVALWTHHLTITPFTSIQAFRVKPFYIVNKLHGALILLTDEKEEYSELENRIIDLASLLFYHKLFILQAGNVETLNQKLKVINEARELINSGLELNDMFSILGDLVLKIAKAQMGTVLLFAKEKLEIQVSWNLPRQGTSGHFSSFEKEFPEILDHIIVPSGETMIAHITRHKTATKFTNFQVPLINDASTIDTVIPEILFIPMNITNNKTIGYLCIIRRDSYHAPFDAHDLQTLETIASLSAQAIENIKLNEEHVREKIVQQELKVAHQIQEGLFPSTIPSGETFDIGAYSKPARMIGGDYYDFFPLQVNGNNFLGVTVTDIVGKGIPAALVMSLFKGILLSATEKALAPKDVFQNINTTLINHHLVKNFIPSVYAILNEATKTVTYSNAGHEIPLYYNAAKDEFFPMDVGGFPLGGFVQANYDECQIELHSGDMLILFTDGIVESRNSRNEFFSEDRLKRLLLQNKELSAQKLVDKIYEKILVYSQDTKQSDDLTLVIIKVK